MSMEDHDEMMSTEENSYFVLQSSLEIISAESSGSKHEERAKRMMNLVLRSIFVYNCKWFLHAVKSYDMLP
jgi:hypothetical protein